MKRSFINIISVILSLLIMPCPCGAVIANAQAPVISISTDKHEIHLGETIKVTVNIENADENTVTTININDSEIEKFEGDLYSINYSPESAGMLDISATASTGERGSTSVDVLPNEGPIVSINNYNNGDNVTLNVSDCTDFTANATDDEKVEKIQFVADGVVLIENEGDNAVINLLEQRGIGTYVLQAVAYDNYGLKGETTLNVTLTNSSDVVLDNVAEFSDGLNGRFSSALTAYDNNCIGFYREGIIDEEHGSSVLIGIEDGDTSTKDFVQLNTEVSNLVSGVNQLKYDFDLNLIQSRNKDGPFIYLGMRRSDASIQYMLNVSKKDGKTIISADNADTYMIEVGKWYHVSILMNIGTNFHWYSIEVTDENGETSVIANKTPANFGTPSRLRFHTGLDKSKTGWCALDNLTVSNHVTVPEIEKLVDEYGNEEEVSYETKELTFKLSALPNTQTINADNIYLINNGKRISVSDVSFDRADLTITLKVGEQLIPGETYTVVFDRSMEITNGIEFGGDVIYKFNVKSSGVSIENEKWFKLGNDVTSTFKIINHNNENKKIYIVSSTWGDNGFIETRAMEQEIAGNSEINKRMIFPNTYKGRVDIYFLSELEHPDVYREISKFGNW